MSRRMIFRRPFKWAWNVFGFDMTLKLAGNWVLRIGVYNQALIISEWYHGGDFMETLKLENRTT